MPALVAGIHDHRPCQFKAPSVIMDCRDELGNDKEGGAATRPGLVLFRLKISFPI
jgi:hypothetical protein